MIETVITLGQLFRERDGEGCDHLISVLPSSILSGVRYTFKLITSTVKNTERHAGLDQTSIRSTDSEAGEDNTLLTVNKRQDEPAE